MKRNDLVIIDHTDPKRWWAQVFNATTLSNCGAYYLQIARDRAHVRAIGLWPQNIRKLKGPPRSSIDEAIYAAVRLHSLAGRL